MWFLPAMKAIIALIPIAYLLIERRIRKRTWDDRGFKSQTFWMDLRDNWFWFELVRLVNQPDHCRCKIELSEVTLSPYIQKTAHQNLCAVFLYLKYAFGKSE